jgi:hypothetical protein
MFVFGAGKRDPYVYLHLICVSVALNLIKKLLQRAKWRLTRLSRPLIKEKSKAAPLRGHTPPRRLFLATIFSLSQTFFAGAQFASHLIFRGIRHRGAVGFFEFEARVSPDYCFLFLCALVVAVVGGMRSGVCGVLQS